MLIDRLDPITFTYLTEGSGSHPGLYINTFFSFKATGDTSYATSAVSLMINECGGIVGRNLSSSINESSDEKQNVPSFLTNIIEKLCPNDCMFNGKCVNGSCICNKEFTAEDCAVSIYQRPDISM